MRILPCLVLLALAAPAGAQDCEPSLQSYAAESTHVFLGNLVASKALTPRSWSPVEATFAVKRSFKGTPEPTLTGDPRPGLQVRTPRGRHLVLGGFGAFLGGGQPLIVGLSAGLGVLLLTQV